MKLRSVQGFSLTEMLVTLLILALASTMLATGVPVALRTYHNTVNSANAQVALSTTATALRRELSLATDIRYDGGKIYYLSPSEHCWISIGNSTDADERQGLEKQYYKGVPSDATGVTGLEETGTPVPLISNAVITDALNVKYGSDSGSAAVVEPAKDVIFKELRVEDAIGNHLANLDEYRVYTPFGE